jgi:ribonuclease HII
MEEMPADKGNSQIEAVSLDECLGNEKVSFIKMDIEGSEYEALLGAKNIIMRDKPKLADVLYDIILEKAVSYGVGIVDEKCIDEINILNATKKAMKIAVNSLNSTPDLLLIDAVDLSDTGIECIPIIRGDSLSVSIAAASIIAKVTRDRLIDKMDAVYPQYGFKKHKGYGTEEHINAIKKYGICPIHRISFTKHFTI